MNAGVELCPWLNATHLIKTPFYNDQFIVEPEQMKSKHLKLYLCFWKYWTLAPSGGQSEISLTET